jgi:hypothetical protein
MSREPNLLATLLDAAECDRIERPFSFKIGEVIERLHLIAATAAQRHREIQVSQKRERIEMNERITLFEDVLSGGRIYAYQQRRRELLDAGRREDADKVAIALHKYRLKLHEMPQFKQQMAALFDRHEAFIKFNEQREEWALGLRLQIKELVGRLTELKAAGGARYNCPLDFLKSRAVSDLLIQLSSDLTAAMAAIDEGARAKLEAAGFILLGNMPLRPRPNGRRGGGDGEDEGHLGDPSP